MKKKTEFKDKEGNTFVLTETEQKINGSIDDMFVLKIDYSNMPKVEKVYTMEDVKKLFGVK